MQKEIQWLLQEKYNGKLTAAAKRDIKKLEAGEPLDFLIGFVEFLGCKIDLSKRPLIPRFETEFWVERAIDDINRDFGGVQNRAPKILDIFSGSGCIGIAVLKHVKGVHVTFADSEKNTIEQIRKNIKINYSPIRANRRIVKGYQVIETDVFSNIKGKFDYILANPPYIPLDKKHKVQKSALDHEPHAALFGGRDGLFFVRKFLAEAKNFLNPNARIYMEFDSHQKAAIQKLLKKYGYKKAEFHKDQYGKWRYLVVI